MSDVVKVLPDSVANQIAAGEVIQRPASAIKELVENAVDAGAHSIKIILRDGGKNLIQVIDDGCGMSDTDARMAFERHATSKITQASDLFDLHTMGFRGEALPSIAAVAQIELHTMRRGASIGTHLEIAASKFESQEPDACPPGTNLAVKNLFFNFPARRKFLKKDSIELSHILHEFERLALVNPDKEFLLVHNDVTLHQLLPASLKQRISDLFGKALQKQLIPVSTETSLVKISGFVSTPESTRKRNPLQYFFVNGRNMRHPYFQKAVLHCYEELIPADHQPNFFLNFEVDASTIDVNIHPTKSEIKFENEAPIWQILVAAIKEAMGKFNVVPSIDFDQTDAIDIPAFHPSESHDFNPVRDESYNPFAPSAATAESESAAATGDASTDNLMASGFNSQSSAMNDWDKLYAGFSADTEHSNDVITPAHFAPDPSYSPFNEPLDIDDLPLAGSQSALNKSLHVTGQSSLNGPQSAPSRAGKPFASALNAFGDATFVEPSVATTPELPEMADNDSIGFLQLKNKYIIMPSHSGLMVIDRHRAHVKVLFEQYIKSELNPESQQVLFPETLTLTPALNVVLENMLDTVTNFGFNLSYLGDNTWAVNGVPASIDKLNPVEILSQMVDGVANETTLPDSGMRQRVALSMAYATAITPGRQLSEAEAEALLSSFLSLPDPAYTPDGLATFTTITYAEITRRLS
jgi:DNA mismatch repair protein MutL